MKVLAVLISLALTLVTPAGADVPEYAEFQLQVRSNIVDGFNLPANSSFNSKTPSLNDSGQVSVCFSVVGGDTTVQGIWLGGNESGSVVWTDPNDGFISDCSLNNPGDVVAELRGFFVSPEGLYLFDSDLGTGRIDQHDSSVVFGGALSINEGGDIAFSAGLTPFDDNQVEWG
ncbi:MAG: hypothetical protein DRJ65_22370, partial [Acidobacteria bacterium]